MPRRLKLSTTDWRSSTLVPPSMRATAQLRAREEGERRALACARFALCCEHCCSGDGWGGGQRACRAAADMLRKAHRSFDNALATSSHSRPRTPGAGTASHRSGPAWRWTSTPPPRASRRPARAPAAPLARPAFQTPPRPAQPLPPPPRLPPRRRQRRPAPAAPRRPRQPPRPTAAWALGAARPLPRRRRRPRRALQLAAAAGGGCRAAARPPQGDGARVSGAHHQTTTVRTGPRRPCWRPEPGRLGTSPPSRPGCLPPLPTFLRTVIAGSTPSSLAAPPYSSCVMAGLRRTER